MKLIGPKKKPKIQPGDFHLVVNDFDESVKIFNSKGELEHKLPCLAKGVRGPSTWRWGGDTPPGLYKLGVHYVSQEWEDLYAVWYPYGKHCFDMVEQENQENERGRAGICLHGGGSSAPDPLAPYQELTPTHGCVRMHNKDIEDYIVPLVTKRNTVWVSVYQDID